jgi:hypothetical protein
MAVQNDDQRRTRQEASRRCPLCLEAVVFDTWAEDAFTHANMRYVFERREHSTRWVHTTEGLTTLWPFDMDPPVAKGLGTDDCYSICRITYVSTV